ncbi:hypothetical protein D3C72_1652190 [compost metagenome]
MPAQFKEVVGQAHPFNLQHLLPDLSDLLFEGTTRRGEGHAGGLLIGCRQGLAVQLAVRRQWQARQEHHKRRHHVTRQLLAQTRLDVGAQGGLIINLVSVLMRGHVGDQLRAPLVLDRQHRRLAHGRQVQQARLDFAELDTKATNLHLMVNTPEVLDDTLGAIAGQVTGAVQTLAQR